jgi:hypothetical protein
MSNIKYDAENTRQMSMGYSVLNCLCLFFKKDNYFYVILAQNDVECMYNVLLYFYYVYIRLLTLNVHVLGAFVVLLKYIIIVFKIVDKMLTVL